jgi:hypothetical protein
MLRENFIRVAFLAGFGLLGSAAAIGQTTALTSPQGETPHVVNATLEMRTVSQNLSATVEQIASENANARWIGYSVERVPGSGQECCENFGGHGDALCGTCRLEVENGGGSTHSHGATAKTVALEGSEKMAVLLRLADKRVMHIRIASNDCTLDAGGLQFVWLTGVTARDSVALLTKFVRAEDFRNESENDHAINEQALTAIALHAGNQADRAFADFVAPQQPSELRKKAAFWLGAARGRYGLILLQKMAKSDADSDVLSQVTFALFVSKEPGATEEMIRMAHDDESTQVRGQALFWLAQKADKKASEAITGAIQNDPDTEVKKKAVFALSQMPKEEGVPKLIDVARTNKNFEVRKQAMFWLGQSNDPRALAFFEKILTQ